MTITANLVTTTTMVEQVVRTMVPQCTDTVTLVLGRREAEILASLCGKHIIGKGETRDVTNSIYSALGKAGVEPKYYVTNKTYLEVSDPRGEY